jgi:peptidyl-prolyl cis-trans isomerase A (cyclophilin A)
MIPGGAPLGEGTGGPGYRFDNEIDSSPKHDGPGVLAMANAGPDTNGSQFYITEKDLGFLDGKYTVFGRCNNPEVVRKIARVKRDARDRPEAPVFIRRVDIIRR